MVKKYLQYGAILVVFIFVMLAVGCSSNNIVQSPSVAKTDHKVTANDCSRFASYFPVKKQNSTTFEYQLVDIRAMEFNPETIKIGLGGYADLELTVRGDCEDLCKKEMIAIGFDPKHQDYHRIYEEIEVENYQGYEIAEGYYFNIFWKQNVEYTTQINTSACPQKYKIRLYAMQDMDPSGKIFIYYAQIDKDENILEMYTIPINVT